MPEYLEKLRPDRDLQCYFERPSAIAALSEATATTFQVTGTWRQQFDWAVLEWNRDNVFEHPDLRNLPDGDLSGLTLTYEESRQGCIGMDSSLYPTVDWPFLRIWANNAAGVERFYRVPLRAYAVPVEGGYVPARADFVLTGALTAGDFVGLSWFEEQYNHQVGAGDTVESVLDSLVSTINSLSPTADAERISGGIRLKYVGAGQTAANSTVGSNANRFGAYGFVSGAKTETWEPTWRTFGGGVSPTVWRVTLNFSNLRDEFDQPVPTTAVRKMRWTYAADLQAGFFARTEFRVHVRSWQVTGSGRTYSVRGASQRIEDDESHVVYTGTWSVGRGNFSGGSISYSTVPGSSATFAFASAGSRSVYLGTRYTFNGGIARVVIDGGPPLDYNLAIAGEDTLARLPIGSVSAGAHTVTVTHVGSANTYVYLDFVEAAEGQQALPEYRPEALVTLATDWDTDHSIAIAAERTAWNVHKMGFQGRVNYYVGALWFYELYRPNHAYASATVTFTGTPVFSEVTTVTIGRSGQPGTSVIPHLNLIGETAADVAKAFELVINSGYTGVWASAQGSSLTIYSRSMGADGNSLTIAAAPSSGVFVAQTSGPSFSGGVDGTWRTDLNAVPRLNRAARDWSRGFLKAVKDFGMDAVSAFSMELQHGDPSPEVGIAQRYPSGNAVVLNTPAIQTNFSPVSLAYWREVYREMAGLMQEAGLTPYLQFGEVQWWYFPYDGSGLPFHDAYTKAQFLSQYGFAIRPVPDGYVAPQTYPEEASFLAGLIGNFTSAVMTHVRVTYPSARFEVLYPTDVNEGAFNRVINYPAVWHSGALDCLKTESFTYTYSRNLNLCDSSIRFSEQKGFPRNKRSHLVGISDALSPWRRETWMAKGERVESVVLFALDQFCLIGYSLPIGKLARRGMALAS